MTIDVQHCPLCTINLLKYLFIELRDKWSQSLLLWSTVRCKILYEQWKASATCLLCYKGVSFDLITRSQWALNEMHDSCLSHRGVYFGRNSFLYALRLMISHSHVHSYPTVRHDQATWQITKAGGRSWKRQGCFRKCAVN